MLTLLIFLVRVFMVAVSSESSCSYKDSWQEGVYLISSPSMEPKENMSLFECIANCFTQNLELCRFMNYWINSSACVFFGDTTEVNESPSGRSPEAIYVDMLKMPSEMADVVGECNGMACAQCTVDRYSRAICSASDTMSGLNKVSEYFHAGYTNQEICLMLRRDNIVISMRTLKRKLNTLGLRRRPQIIDDERVLYAIQSELEGSGCCLGYRSMTARLRNVHGLRVPRDYVRNILKLLEPERVAERTTRRFNRHTYINFGPNYLVHIDGYDKLKPFGFAIHGAMCGYSRRILWLKVAETNNDPYTVAYFFMEYVKTNGGVPRCIRADRGTENIFIEDLQKAMRWDHQDNMSADNSFIYGSSCRNQRIERWWLSLRQGGGNYWINLFKDMEIEGVISKDSALHIEILRFCFTEIIQRELDIIAAEWNQHAVRGSNGISGKPDILYFLPQAKGTTDYKTMVDTNDIEALTRMCRKPTPSGCASDFEELCDTLLQLNDRIKPSNVREAMDTFAWLLTKLG